MSRRASHAMRSITTRRLRNLFVTLLVAATSCQIRAAQDVHLNKRVLVIYEMNRSAPAVEALDEGLRKALNGHSVDLYVEFMETNLFLDLASQREMQASYAHKYRDHMPDVIIAAGATPVQFMLEDREKDFAGIPLVVCGATQMPSGKHPKDNFTGTWLSPDPLGTLRAALKLKPDTRNVFVVNGAAAVDTSVDDVMRKSFRDVRGNLTFTYLKGLPMPDLLSRLKDLPSRSIIMYGAVTQDTAGKRYFAASESLPMVLAAANAPVFVLAETMVGNGAVGGHVASFHAQGKLAGEQALQILQGKQTSSIPMVPTLNEDLFDAKALQRWGLQPSQLSSRKTLLNQPASFLERRGRALLLFAIVMPALVVILFQWRGAIAAREALETEIEERQASIIVRLDLTRRLLNAQETERSRIARELHDGIGQEIALLGIQIQRAPSAASNDDGGKQTMREFGSKLASIGTRVGNLSHHLHSSELELLGLAVAISKLCREFSENSAMTFTYTCTDISADLDGEVALSCFRLLQESLHNVAKHSHASAGSVTVTQQGRELTIAVHDNGRGFDILKARGAPGLGLLSMRERMSLIGGVVEITSVPGIGTTVTARVSIN
jgi:signal transduction histidine kinase/ABC-type uncharacterized transport system substrate-binding protein